MLARSKREQSSSFDRDHAARMVNASRELASIDGGGKSAYCSAVHRSTGRIRSVPATETRSEFKFSVFIFVFVTEVFSHGSLG
jgi:hypothetical protein